MPWIDEKIAKRALISLTDSMITWQHKPKLCTALLNQAQGIAFCLGLIQFYGPTTPSASAVEHLLIKWRRDQEE